MQRDVHGQWESRFAPVVEAFQEGVNAQPEGGAAVAIYHHGERVVHAWAGDAAPGRAWAADTPSVMFSCTKGLLSILALRLVEQGRLDLDAPVSAYWPEFAQHGKGDMPVAWLLQHRAGLAAPREDVTLEQLIAGEPLDALLAAQEPLWKPGTEYAYHAITFGNLVGRVVRSVIGHSISQEFRDVITSPLSADAWIGLPAAVEPRVTELNTDDGFPASAEPETADYWALRALTLGGAIPAEIATPGGGFNDPRMHAAELPGVGAIATADALARIWSAAVTETNGVRLLSDAMLRHAMVPSTLGPNAWGVDPTWAVRGLGLMVNNPGSHVLLSDDMTGHDGLGGQAGFGDLGHRLGFAYLTNHLMSGPDALDRWHRIMEALRSVLSEN